MDGYEKLWKNLIDTMKEQQLKIGFFDGEVRLYYPLVTLNHFFGATDTQEEMCQRLAKHPKKWEETLGKMQVSAKDERFCFLIPKEGSEYVRDHSKPDEFIAQLISLVGAHGTTMEQIRDLFYQKTDKVEEKLMHNGEFDCMLRFLDDAEDPYYYCFKNEGCHLTYHRFLPADYEEFGFE